ncbi:MAG: DUF58 domain-containing protein [Puniceicoccales bacterium]|jgi:uncharacterized protein (DUF58 family)|nr:DUF58 domain-containing protein [Puniceicoccales bacterium]
MNTDTETEITRNVLRRVRQLEIRTNRLLDEHLMGAYRSIFKGQGIDFEEVREYMPGDDIRSIDWNITAKMNKPFIKKFREDRELTVLLVVDVSASLDFGSIFLSKREVLTEISSLLAFSATRNNDKVGLLLFSDQIEKFVPPAKGRKHILRIIRDVLFFEPKAKGTQLINVIKYVNNILKKKAIIFLLSDFLEPKIQNIKQLTDALEITNRRHDLVCLKVEDGKEYELPPMGLVVFEDAETADVLQINTSDKQFQIKYKKEKIYYNKILSERLKKVGIDFLEVNTKDNYLQSLDKFLRGHRARK